MARKPELTKHPALMAKTRQGLAGGVPSHPDWEQLDYPQQQWLAEWLVTGDAYAAGEKTGKSAPWVAEQLSNEALLRIIEQVKESPTAYVLDVAKMRSPAVMERLFQIIMTSNDNTSRMAIRDWFQLLELVKTPPGMGNNVNYSNYNIKMFGNQGNRPPPSLADIDESADIIDLESEANDT